MDDLQKNHDNNRDIADDSLDLEKRQAEAEAEEAQAVINEAKEDATRDWDNAYSDVEPEPAPGDTEAELEGDARRKKDGLEGTVVTNTPPDVDGTQEDLQARMTEAADDLRTRSADSGHDAHDSDRSVVDDIQDKAKDIIDRVKGAMNDGDKKS